MTGSNMTNTTKQKIKNIALWIVAIALVDLFRGDSG
jgi:hypothetical protein